jgi:hypothetical protein
VTHHEWSGLAGTDLIAFGKDIVARKLERLGCMVTPPSNPRDGKLAIRTRAGRRVEVFVSTQRVGGYAFWTKRRLQPSDQRFAVLVLLGDNPGPGVYLIPSLDWSDASPPLTDRDYEGGKSEPEYGIEISESSVPMLRRYAWTDASAEEHFR